VPAAGRTKESWNCDSNGRWTQRIDYSWNGSAYVPQSTNGLIWMGKVLLAILDYTNGLVMSFARGLDMDGSQQGLGGVGGLIAVRNQTNGTHFSAFDGNGNVSALVSASTGAASGVYEYEKFGMALRVTGSAASANPMRFSTQYSHPGCGRLKYLYRDHQPWIGKWLSRDQINEPGFKILTSRTRRPFYKDEDNALYAFVRNEPISEIDGLGLRPCKLEELAECALGCATKTGEYFVGVRPGSCKYRYYFFFCRISCICRTRCDLESSLELGRFTLCSYICKGHKNPEDHETIIVPTIEGCPETIVDDVSKTPAEY
jgi:RHS repeat-associated protein